MLENGPTIDTLRQAVILACRPQNAHRIVAGREQVLAMPRDWVLQRIEQVAIDSLDLSDEWEYLRFLELAESLDHDLVQRFVLVGLSSNNPEVREAAEDFRREEE